MLRGGREGCRGLASRIEKLKKKRGGNAQISSLPDRDFQKGRGAALASGFWERN